MKQKNENQQRLLYNRAEAAKLLSLSIGTLNIAIARGMIIGKKRLIPHSALVAFSQKNLPLIWPAKLHGKTIGVKIAKTA